MLNYGTSLMGYKLLLIVTFGTSSFEQTTLKLSISFIKEFVMVLSQWNLQHIPREDNRIAKFRRDREIRLGSGVQVCIDSESAAKNTNETHLSKQWLRQNLILLVINPHLRSDPPFTNPTKETILLGQPLTDFYPNMVSLESNT
ncbi:hypothetical protein EPI10_032970 [Gossypium australe]|uniref:Uncharacterized protein n=1 Tax=Gossypium australe TaxID=47621 RepID=A0A5B6X529_9ROSI|nr:hypothetical protein EPI10_032970 [Gossypium australe]